MTDRDDRAQQLRQITADLDAKLLALTTSDDWRSALDVAARFHNYSLNNVLYLMMQAERREIELTHVAGFKTWQSLGRQVRKGEKSLKVLAPCRYKVTDERSGEDRMVVRGFTVASVFDLSQTDGDELPGVQPKTLEGDVPDLLNRVVDAIEARGFAVTFQVSSSMGGANGFTDHAGRRVVIRSDAASAQQTKTAVHELAHVILHEPGVIDYRANRARCECEAESVAYVVCRALGVETDAYSLPYVASWSGGDVATVRAVADVVVKTAHSILAAVDVIDLTSAAEPQLATAI